MIELSEAQSSDNEIEGVMRAIAHHYACRVHLVNRADLHLHLLIGQCRIEVITDNDTHGAERVVEGEMVAERGMGFTCECM